MATYEAWLISETYNSKLYGIYRNGLPVAKAKTKNQAKWAIRKHMALVKSEKQGKS